MEKEVVVRGVSGLLRGQLKEVRVGERLVLGWGWYCYWLTRGTIRID
jgi:uncharacterized cupin superfamily protein